MPGLIIEARKNLRNFDVIHLHCYRSFQNLVLCRYARRFNVPYVMDSHGSLPKFVRKKFIKSLFDLTAGQRILQDAARCIGEGELGVREYVDAGVGRNRVVRITPPFPVEDFREVPVPGEFRKKFNIIDEQIVMFLGRIHWIKGLDFLVEGFGELAKFRDDVLLLIVGPDDGYRASLEKLIENKKLSARVKFTGFLGGKEKLAALVDADVVVQTSRYEQGAWAPIEAVLCGTPIIVSDNSGAGEDVRELDAGYLVEFDNRDDLRQKIEYVLDNPAETNVKTQTARKYVQEHLSMDGCLENYDRLYKDCIKERDDSRKDGNGSSIDSGHANLAGIRE